MERKVKLHPDVRGMLRAVAGSYSLLARRFASTNVKSAAPSCVTETIATKCDEDGVVENMENPYKKERRLCLLCAKRVELDYKNARLLQQFISTFSGRVYDRHVTGLCDHQQKKLLATIALSRRAGYMPVMVKDPKYLRDAKLFDPLKPLRPHSYA